MKLAVIPARGGSQRIPKKNIRSFCGKPIIAYSIAAALDSEIFDRVMVSTDSGEISEVAKSFGAEIPFIRPKELADAHTGTNPVVKHALQWHDDHGFEVEFACCIYSTAPFVTPDSLKDGFEKLSTTGADFAFSVAEFSSPIQRAMHLKSDFSVEPIWPENIPRRSQDLEPCYHDAGQFYWGKKSAFLNELKLFSSHSVGVLRPKHLVQDIDTMEDWIAAEAKFKALQILENDH